MGVCTGGWTVSPSCMSESLVKQSSSSVPACFPGHKLPQCPAAGPSASLSTALPAGVYQCYLKKKKTFCATKNLLSKSSLPHRAVADNIPLLQHDSLVYYSLYIARLFIRTDFRDCYRRGRVDLSLPAERRDMSVQLRR